MNLVIPETVLDQHLVVLGKTGAGKSTVLRGLAENRLTLKKRVCIIDPKGDWWGLKSSRDGKSAGFPIIGIGNFKDPQATDIAIHPHAGKAVAELVATGNRPCVIGFRGWMPADMTRFWVDFASTLFNMNHGELFLFVDEVHNFAPKGRVLDVEAGKCLHWTNRLMSEGRGLGIVALIASQRPQKVHNDTLTCCETLVAMRVNHAADREAIRAWIDGCGDRTMGNKLLDSVANMKRGEAYVWSPEAGYGPTHVKFPMFQTFDSFAPPQLQGAVSERGWSTTDLATVKEKLNAVIEQATANDPAVLKQRIRQLEAELAKKPQPIAAPPPPPVPVMSKEQDEMLRDIVNRIATLEMRRAEDGEALRQIQTDARDLRAELRGRVPPSQIPAVRPVKVVQSVDVLPIPNVKSPSRDFAEQAVADPSLTGAQRKVLTVLAQHKDGCSKGPLALLSGYTYSGGFRNILSSLRTGGLIDGGNEEVMRITDAGRFALGPYDELPTGLALAEYWLNSSLFGGGEKAVLRVLLENVRGLPAEELATAAGYTYSGGFRNILSTLRTAGVIVGKNTELIRAHPALLS